MRRLRYALDHLSQHNPLDTQLHTFAGARALQCTFNKHYVPPDDDDDDNDDDFVDFRGHFMLMSVSTCKCDSIAMLAHAVWKL